MKNHIVLFQPQIPGNTGNISRTCVATNTALHLIYPLGFSTDDKMLKRAGLDYWSNIELHEHESLESFLKEIGDHPLYLVTKHAHHTYSDLDYTKSVDEDIYFMFGNETFGLPNELLEKYKNSTIRLPMNDDHVRSLNLSNACAIVVYEALRQQSFESLDLVHHYRDTEKSRQLNW